MGRSEKRYEGFGLFQLRSGRGIRIGLNGRSGRLAVIFESQPGKQATGQKSEHTRSETLQRLRGFQIVHRRMAGTTGGTIVETRIAVDLHYGGGRDML